MKCGEIAIWIFCLENLLISAPLSTGLLPSLYCTKLADSRATNSHITPHLIQNNNLYYTGARSWACLKLTILRLFEHYVMLYVDSRWITRLTHSEQPIHLSTIHILLCFDFLLFCTKKEKKHCLKPRLKETFHRKNHREHQHWQFLQPKFSYFLDLCDHYEADCHCNTTAGKHTKLEATFLFTLQYISRTSWGKKKYQQCCNIYQKA